MKKFIIMLLVAIFALNLFGCDKDPTTIETANEPIAENTPITNVTPTATPTIETPTPAKTTEKPNEAPTPTIEIPDIDDFFATTSSGIEYLDLNAYAETAGYDVIVIIDKVIDALYCKTEDDIYLFLVSGERHLFYNTTEEEDIFRYFLVASNSSNTTENTGNIPESVLLNNHIYKTSHINVAAVISWLEWIADPNDTRDDPFDVPHVAGKATNMQLGPEHSDVDIMGANVYDIEDIDYLS